MSKNEIYATIKSTVNAYLPDARVLLFGSHARGDNDRYSDYDLLVITPSELSRTEKVNLTTTLDKALVHTLHAPFDVLVYSENEVSRKRVLPGHIIRTAMREGLAL